MSLPPQPPHDPAPLAPPASPPPPDTSPAPSPASGAAVAGAPRAPAAAAIPRRRPHLLPALVFGLPLLAALGLGGAGMAGLGLWRALHTESGSRQVLDWAGTRLPGLQLVQPRGAVLGPGRFSLQQLSLSLGRWQIQAEDLGWTDLRLDRPRLSPPFLRVQAERLDLGRLRLQARGPAPADAAPPRLPADLVLPVRLQITRLQAQRIELPGLPGALRDVAARIEAGRPAAELAVAVDTAPAADPDADLPPAAHRIDALRLHWRGLQLSGQARLGDRGPMPLQLRLQLQGTAAPAVGEAAGAGGPAAARSASKSSDHPRAAVAASGAAPAAPDLDPDGLPPLPPALRQLALRLRLDGPLARPAAELALRLAGQRLDARATLQPLAALPLQQLEAGVEALDLAPLAAAFGAQAPRSALSGRLQLALSPDAPMRVAVHLDNAQPGRWDQGRLPLARLDAVLHGAGRQWRVEQAEATLAGGTGSAAAAPAGRLRLQGELTLPPAGRSLAAAHGQLALQLDRLRLPALDQRAPPLLLSGPLRLTHAPVEPVADPSGPARPGAARAAAAPRPSAADPGMPAPTPTPAAAAGPAWGRLGLEARLDGRLSGPAAERAPAVLRDAPVQLRLQGEARPGRLSLPQLSARAGTTALDAQLQLQGRWAGGTTDAAPGHGSQLDLGLHLADFDPRLWLPGPPEAAWRRGRHALRGQAKLQLATPPGPAPAAADPRRWQGQVQARLDPGSQLASLPLALDLQAQADGRAWAQVRLQAGLAGNRIAGQGSWPLSAAAAAAVRPPGMDPAALALQIDAPVLQALAPLWPGPQAPTGRLQAEISLDQPRARSGPDGADPGTDGGTGDGAGTPATAGLPWPGRSQGQASARALRLGPGLALEQLDGRWRLRLPDPGGRPAPAEEAEPLEAELSLQDARLPGLRLDRARLQLQGRPGQHQLALDARLRPLPAEPAAPAPAAEGNGTGVPPPSRFGPLDLQARLAGAWRAAAPAGGRWQVRLEELLLRAAPASVPPAAPGQAPAEPLLQAGPLQLELQHDGQGLLQASVQPGQLSLLGLPLRWERLRVARPGGEAPLQLQIEAQLPPVHLPRLLARLQPEVGWGGDLRVGGHLRLDTASPGGLQLDAALQREGGDLQLSEFGLTEALRLSALKLAVQAEAGRWRFTQEIAGAGLGRIDGEQRLQAAGPRAWPAPGDPVHGALRLAVDSLAGWAAWVPPGWRLGGQVEAGLALGGPLGSPELTGRLTGRDLSLRHALEGVALSGGAVDLQFDGRSGRLDRVEFQAGEGRLRAEGEARFGSEPSATVRLSAEQARVLARVDRRLVVSGQAELQIDRHRARLHGRLAAQDGLIDIRRADAPRLGEDVVVRRGPAPAAPDRAPEPALGRAPARALDLDLRVALGPRVQLRGRGLDTRLLGELRLSAPRGSLLAQGEIRTDRGVYEAYGQKLSIQKGVVTFVGDLGNPRLDIEAVRAISDTTVGVRVGGSAQAPRVKLFSEPELPDTDKLALLVTGRRYDSLAGSETLILQRAALALLAGEGGDDFSLARSFRLDEFAVRQDETGSVRDTVVTLGKQLSERVYLGYERGLAAAAGNVQLIYRIAQRFTLRAQSGSDNALDLIWTWQWD